MQIDNLYDLGTILYEVDKASIYTYKIVDIVYSCASKELKYAIVDIPCGDDLLMEDVLYISETDILGKYYIDIEMAMIAMEENIKSYEKV